MMNRLVLFAVCVLFVLSEAIRLETLARTWGVLQQEGVIDIDDAKDTYEFDVILAVRLKITDYDKRGTASLWKVHGVWEPVGSVASADEADRMAKKVGTPYTKDWSAAVVEHNTDANPKRTKGQIVKRLEERGVLLPTTPVPAALIAEMTLRMVNHEYRDHGYYLPIPTSAFYKILQSPAMTTMKTGCAEAAEVPNELPDKRPTSPLEQVVDKGGIKYLFRVNGAMADCLVNARVSVIKATYEPTVILPTAALP